MVFLRSVSKIDLHFLFFPSFETRSPERAVGWTSGAKQTLAGQIASDSSQTQQSEGTQPVTRATSPGVTKRHRYQPYRQGNVAIDTTRHIIFRIILIARHGSEEVRLM